MSIFDRYTDYASPQTTDRFLVRDATSGLPKSVTFTNLRNAISTASGDASTNTSSSIDGELALFSGTGGKTLKRATTTGLIKASSGVIAAAVQGTDYYAPGGTDVAIADGGTGASSASAARTALGLAIGTDVQAHGAILDDLNAISASQGDVVYNNGTNWVRLGAGTNGQVLRTNGVGANPSWGTSSAGQTLYEAVVAASNADYTTIGAAVAAGKTRIFVRNGTYSESAIALAANTHITGESMDGVIIQMGTGSMTLAANCHIDNVAFTTWGTGGAITGSSLADLCTLSCIKIDVSTSTTVPIQLSASPRFVIRDCQFLNSTGTVITTFITDGSPGASGIITNNVFRGNFVQALLSVTGSIYRITDNWISSTASTVNGSLINLNASTVQHDTYIGQNYLVGSGGTQHYGITLNASSRVTIADNHIGVGNSFARCINLINVDSVYVHGNYTEDGAVGIYIDSACTNIMTRNNYLKRNATPVTNLGAGTDAAGNIVTAAPRGVIADHYADGGNTSTTETDLYTDTTVANQLFLDGDKIKATYSGIFVNSTSTKQLKAYFAGTAIFDSTALTTSAATSWELRVVIIRSSSTTARCSATIVLSGASISDATTYTALTGLTLSGTNILKITGTAAGVGAATNDIVAKLGIVESIQAAGI